MAVEATLNITVISTDVTAPVLTVPADIIITQFESPDPATTGQATATDDIDPSPVVTYSDSADGADPNPYTITRTWTATDSNSNSSQGDQVIRVVQAAFETPGAEATTVGTVSGSYADTTTSDNTYEGLTEESTTTSALDHEWTFNLTAADFQTFYVEAYHTTNGENDDFVFLYSTDGVNYTEMLTVTKTADDDTIQSYQLPQSVTGTVYVAVFDTDNTNGNTVADTLYVDDMGFYTERWPAGSLPPGAPSSPSPADGATGVAISSLLGWTSGSDSLGADVYFGTVNPPTGSEFLTSTVGTAADPGTLAYSTTYYWQVKETNSLGTTEGKVWPFTTEASPVPQPTDMHVESIVATTTPFNKIKDSAIATVTVHDDLGQPVSGATVTVAFSGDIVETVTAVTDASGVAVLTTIGAEKSPLGFTATVTGVTHATLPYDAADNVMTSQTY